VVVGERAARGPARGLAPELTRRYMPRYTPCAFGLRMRSLSAFPRYWTPVRAYEYRRLERAL
jgi:hypothetical protein